MENNNNNNNRYGFERRQKASCSGQALRYRESAGWGVGGVRENTRETKKNITGNEWHFLFTFSFPLEMFLKYF